jgi:formylglycine-generating enzyme required for sulfatase activity/class 3 adenylate cyclase
MESDLKRKLAAILVADIVGYSRLIASDEEATLRRLEVFRAMWQDCAGRYGGRIFNTAGDAVLAEFPSAVEAVRCATDFQAQAAKHNQSLVPDRQMHFRVGITIGDVVQRGGDLLGDGVNIAARLQGLAEKGGICVSSWVRESVVNKLNIKFADLGEQTVKNIPEPIRAYAIVSPGSSSALTGASARQQAGRAGSLSGRAMIIAAVVVAAIGIAAAFMFAAQLSSSTKSVVAEKTPRPSTSPTATPISQPKRDARSERPAADDPPPPPKSSDIGELFKKAKNEPPVKAQPIPPKAAPQEPLPVKPIEAQKSARPSGPAVPQEVETSTSGDGPPPPTKTAKHDIREDDPPARKADEQRTGDATPVPREKADPLSETAERELKSGDPFRECPACPSMVGLPAGSFVMGSPGSQYGHNADESPMRRVAINYRLALSQFPVTVAQFDTFVTVSGYRPGDTCRVFEGGNWVEKSGWSYRNPGFPQDGDHPVTCVNWNDAVAYANWLTARTGKPYRLPSEAEWEYAARAGTTTAFWWGDSIGPDNANYDWSIAYGSGRRGTMRHGTMPVKSFRPNPWQLYQVHGNVSEWVEDCWNANYTGAPTDGSARLSGTCSLRILRGGSWGYDPKELRSAYREGVTQSHRNFNFGFRVARTLGSN